MLEVVRRDVERLGGLGHVVRGQPVTQEGLRLAARARVRRAADPVLQHQPREPDQAGVGQRAPQRKEAVRALRRREHADQGARLGRHRAPRGRAVVGPLAHPAAPARHLERPLGLARLEQRGEERARHYLAIEHGIGQRHPARVERAEHPVGQHAAPARAVERERQPLDRVLAALRPPLAAGGRRLQAGVQVLGGERGVAHAVGHGPGAVVGQARGLQAARAAIGLERLVELAQQLGHRAAPHLGLERGGLGHRGGPVVVQRLAEGPLLRRLIPGLDRAPGPRIRAIAAHRQEGRSQGDPEDPAHEPRRDGQHGPSRRQHSCHPGRGPSAWNCEGPAGSDVTDSGCR